MVSQLCAFMPKAHIMSAANNTILFIILFFGFYIYDGEVVKSGQTLTLFNFTLVSDVVNQGHEQTKGEEAAGRQYHHQHAVGTAYQAVTEEAAGTQQLAHHAQQGQCPGEAESHEETVEERLAHIVLRGKRLSAPQHDAVHHDKGNKQTQAVVQRGQIGFHHHLHHGHEGGYDDYERRYTHLVGYHTLEERYDYVRHHEHKGGGQAHAHAVDGRCGGGQRGAHAEDEHPCGVLLDKAVLDNIFSLHNP